MQTMHDKTLIQQAEAIEREALAALHSVADKPLRAKLGISLKSIGDSLVSTAEALPDSAITINRAVGMGRQQSTLRETLAAITEHYRQACVRRYFLQPDPCTQDEDLAPHFYSAGFVRARAWQKFIRGRNEPIPDVRTDLTIVKAGQAQGEAFADLVCGAFDLGGNARPWLARLAAARGWHIYMAFDGNTPASAGAVFIHGKDAYTDFGATAPAYRQRGLQLANLANRVRAAIDFGCQRIHSCTGIAIEGDPQHSYSNIKRCGFVETHVRQTWAPSEQAR